MPHCAHARGYANEPIIALRSADVTVTNTISLVTIGRPRQAGVTEQLRATGWSSVAQQRWNRHAIANTSQNHPGWACDAPTTGLPVQRMVAADRQARAHQAVTLWRAGQFTVPPACTGNLTGAIAAGVPVFWNLRRERR